MKRLLFICCVAAYSTTLKAQQPLKLSLQDCIKAAIANNAAVVQGGLAADAQKVRLNSARMSMLPNLNASANTGIQNGRSIDPFTNAYSTQEIRYADYGLSSKVVLFNGLYLQNTNRQNKLEYEATRMDFKNAKDKIAIDIVLNYLQVLNNDDLLQQTKQQAALSKKQVERLALMNKEGAISPYLLYDLKGQYATDEVSIIAARNALETARLNLCRLMNIPYNSQLQLERIDTSSIATGLDDHTPANTYSSALQELALIRAADLHVMSSEKAVRAARGRMFPELSLGGNANTNYSSAAFRNIFQNTTDVTSKDYVLVNGVASQLIRKQDNFLSEKIKYGDQLKNNVFSSFSVNLSIPLFNGAFYRNNSRLAKINLKSDQVVAKTTRTQLQLAIEQAYIDKNTAAEKYQTLAEQVRAFDESFRSAEIRFNEGVVTSVDYLVAKNNLDRARINFITSGYELLLRRKVLDYYEGKPLW